MVNAANVLQNCFEAFIAINEKIDGMQHGILAIARFCKNQLGERTIQKINDSFEYINILPYLNKVDHVRAWLSGEVAHKYAGKPIKLASSLLMLFAKTSKYLWSVPPLISSHPWILTAASVAKSANKLFQGMGFILLATSVKLEPDNGSSISYLDYFKMINFISICYILAGPVLMKAPPLYAAASMTSGILSGVFFAKEIAELGLGVTERIVNVVLERFIFSDMIKFLDPSELCFR